MFSPCDSHQPTLAYRGRFAPSPSGPLHFGSLVAAVGTWVRARARGGVWLVRMEDIDPPREMPGAAADILHTLTAFGMQSDEPVMYQSRREAAYRDAFERLQAMGTVFECRCSRADLESQRGLHRRSCVSPPDTSHLPCWRLRVADTQIDFDDLLLGPQSQNLRRDVGDFVIRRVEGWYAYQLAVVVDDAEQGITEVVRGADLLDSTPRQIHLQRLLGYPAPTYLHLPLVVDATGRKLSKQDRDLRVDHTDPAPALRAALKFLDLHADAAARSVDDLLLAAVRHFDIAGLRSAANGPGRRCVQSAHDSSSQRRRK
ncbi:MAG: tRNA glutamyl-Q(34) synthetase GluQRS [Rudaea sp.]